MSKREEYVTTGGIHIQRTVETLPLDGAIEPIIDALDSKLGVLLNSGFEFPGRYTRWDMGFYNPPIQIVTSGRSFTITALNDRGQLLLPALKECLANVDAVDTMEADSQQLHGSIKKPTQRFTEEERSRQFSVFSILRALIQLFHSQYDDHLGLYGAFGYDLAFQFESVEFKTPRPQNQRDIVLYIPDELVIVDHNLKSAERYSYDFQVESHSTTGLPRTGLTKPYVGKTEVPRSRDHEAGEYAQVVRKAHDYFKQGKLFEVVPSQTFYEPCTALPSQIFRHLRKLNPAPYASFMNLGSDEYLVGASPEMYVRSEGRRIETCPISGTIARGEDAIGDAEQILKLLSSKKEESELTMCTDVDRNDKSRICEPGSIRVIGRRQIEMYSKLIHTVDHVEGILREGFDALDAFLTHTWAVTVTGAPKLWAMRFIEESEKSYRSWYGGAIGKLGFNGNINTGLTLRTIRVYQGSTELRVGATLLIDSVPEEEEKETELKSSAFLEAIRQSNAHKPEPDTVPELPHVNKKVMLVDHEDSFVNTLADYIRQSGAMVQTIRITDYSQEQFVEQLTSFQPDLVVLSPGPGCPDDFAASTTIETLLQHNLPIFGICLGLQGLVEYFGGKLDMLSYPMHGKPSTVQVRGGRIFEDLPPEFIAGRYHSLHADRTHFPKPLTITAESEDSVVMAIEHKELPIAAVQFHPESIMTLDQNIGMRLIKNVLRTLAR